MQEEELSKVVLEKLHLPIVSTPELSKWKSYQKT